MQSQGRVVLVNDDRIQRLHLCRLLESEGLVAIPFPGAVEALEGLQCMAPPDLIITDNHIHENSVIICQRVKES